MPLLVDIFDKGKLVYNLPSLSEIQEYARKNYDQLWDEYKRVLNPQHYPVDLAKDIWQDKMDLIEEMRNKANGEGEAKMSLQEEIIQQLGVKPSIDPQEEIRRSVDFLKKDI